MEGAAFDGLCDSRLRDPELKLTARDVAKKLKTNFQDPGPVMKNIARVANA
jgi:hypothetical protein